MKTYEERRKETTMEPDDRQELLRLATEANDRAQRAIRLMLEAGHTHRATEAELRAEIEKEAALSEMLNDQIRDLQMDQWKIAEAIGSLHPMETNRDEIVIKINALRAAFNAVATVIQGAYVNGQLPPISDAELAEKIITEYSSKRASAYEQGKRGDLMEKDLGAVTLQLKTAQDEAWANWNSFRRAQSEIAALRQALTAISEVPATIPEVESHYDLGKLGAWRNAAAMAKSALNQSTVKDSLTVDSDAREQGKRADDQQALSAIEAIVADDFCEDLDMRQGDLSGDMAVAHRKLAAVYRIAHSHVTSHVCFDVHDDWRRDTAPTDRDALAGCADDAIPLSNVDAAEAKLRALGDLWNKLSGSGSQKWTQEMPTVLFDALDQLCADVADASPQPESAERKEHVGE